MKLIAVSGGVDSMVLLDKYRIQNVSVIHINHNTRGKENIKEQKLVEEVCKQNNIPCYTFNYIHDGRGNFQHKARQYRYLKFKEICHSKNCEEVLTAHHFDDQIENILMNPLKIGKKTIDARKEIDGINVVRPLLSITKQELYNYAKANNIKYYEDSSNKEKKYLRNKIRFQLKSYTYEQKEEILKKENIRYEKILRKIKSFSKNKVYTKEILTQEDVYAFLKANKINSNISLSKIKLILKFIKQKTNGEIRIDNDNKLIIAYSQVYLISEEQLQKPIIEFQNLQVGNNSFNGLSFFNENLKGNVRIHKKTDTIKLKNGTKKINRFFIDNKIPKHLRTRWPIIVDEYDKIIKVIKPQDIIKEI